jgi:hypothetical protein
VLGLIDKMSEKTPTLATNEYSNHVDRRRRQKEHLLNAPYVESDNFASPKRHGEDHHVQFRVSPFAEKVGSEVADLFCMSFSQYAKAVLYRDLGLVFEPIDRRKTRR